VRELVVIAGRGAGKDSIASLIATMAALNFNPRGQLRPGERAVVMCLAVDRSQARIVHGYIRAYFEQIPELAALVKNTTRNSISLINGVDIQTFANDFKSLRGRSLLAAVFDELAFWSDENSATPDVETALAVAPGLARMKNSMW
jgi:phage terminase large subunit-like protein